MNCLRVFIREKAQLQGYFLSLPFVHNLFSVAILVFYNETWEWQFRIINGSAVFGERKLYFSPQAAEKAAREWINRSFIKKK